MKVLFLKDVSNVAHAGEIKEVSDGYATNYLLPKKLAQRASADVQNRFEAQRRSEAKRVAEQAAEMKALADKISGRVFTLAAKTGGGEKLYGSVTNADIAAEVSRTIGVEIDKRKIEMTEVIRALGSYDVSIKLYKNLSPRIKVKIVPESAG
ncbi:MAG: 50S ribosomal protein L9 [Dehalococcoidia bacterium]|nr:50S ribosomal protein L9 [Dehalococcoidia bacterium]